MWQCSAANRGPLNLAFNQSSPKDRIVGNTKIAPHNYRDL